MNDMATALQIADGVRTGDVSAADVVEQHLAAIAERDGEIHAFNHVTADAARERAAEVDAAVAAGDDPGPLAGVPVALKDRLRTTLSPIKSNASGYDAFSKGPRPSLNSSGRNHMLQRFVVPEERKPVFQAFLQLCVECMD